MKKLETRDLRTNPHCAPTLPEGEEMIYDLPGRVLVCKPESTCDVTYQSHYLRVGQRFGSAALYVRHGGGQEVFRLHSPMLRVLADMTDDQRYFALYAIMDAHYEAARAARASTEQLYRQAHADGRLKRRKVRGQAAMKVWIEPAKAVAP